MAQNKIAMLANLVKETSSQPKHPRVDLTHAATFHHESPITDNPKMDKIDAPKILEVGNL